MKIYIIRHAQTQDNVDGIIQGQTDSPLTAQGMADLRRTADYLADKKIEAIVSSPIGRAHQTAKMIGEALQIEEIVLDDRLKEIDLKPWEKKKKSELLGDTSPKGYDVYRGKPHLFCPEAGEDLFRLQERMIDGFCAHACKNIGKNIALISHDVAIRTLLIALRSQPMEQLWHGDIPPSSITEIEGFDLIKTGFTP